MNIELDSRLKQIIGGVVSNRVVPVALMALDPDHRRNRYRIIRHQSSYRLMIDVLGQQRYLTLKGLDVVKNMHLVSPFHYLLSNFI